MVKKLVYVVDDEPLQLHFLSVTLGKMGFAVDTFHSARELLVALDKRVPHAIVVDLVMPEMSGIELIAEVRKRSNSLPLIAVTAYPEIETAMSAVRAGANDYLKKPYEKAELQFVVHRLIEATHLRDNYESLLDKEASRFALDAMIGSSPAMQEVRSTLRRLADVSDAAILLTGEPGSGKSFAARVLHYARPDPMSRLVEVNCATLTEKELMAELFGHTSAGPSPGPTLFDLSEGGTLILEAITEMGLKAQEMLAARLQQEQADRSSDTPVAGRRIVATSVSDISDKVRDGSFIPALAELLSLFPLRLPSLTDRQKDIVELARHFVEVAESSHVPRLQGLTVGAEGVLQSYDWPGNVRELRSVMERAISVSHGPFVTADDLRMKTVAVHAEEISGEEPLSSLREIEIRQIRRVLAFTGGDISKAAAILGISRKSLWERRKRYSIS